MRSTFKLAKRIFDRLPTPIQGLLCFGGALLLGTAIHYAIAQKRYNNTVVHYDVLDVASFIATAEDGFGAWNFSSPVEQTDKTGVSTPMPYNMERAENDFSQLWSNQRNPVAIFSTADIQAAQRAMWGQEDTKYNELMSHKVVLDIGIAVLATRAMLPPDLTITENDLEMSMRGAYLSMRDLMWYGLDENRPPLYTTCFNGIAAIIVDLPDGQEKTLANCIKVAETQLPKGLDLFPQISQPDSLGNVARGYFMMASTISGLQHSSVQSLYRTWNSYLVGSEEEGRLEISASMTISEAFRNRDYRVAKSQVLGMGAVYAVSGEIPDVKSVMQEVAHAQTLSYIKNGSYFPFDHLKILKMLAPSQDQNADRIDIDPKVFESALGAFNDIMYDGGWINQDPEFWKKFCKHYHAGDFNHNQGVQEIAQKGMKGLRFIGTTHPEIFDGPFLKMSDLYPPAPTRDPTRKMMVAFRERKLAKGLAQN